MNAGSVHAVFCLLGSQRREEALVYQFLDCHWRQDRVKQRIAVRDEAMAQAVGRGGQADHAQRRVDSRQRLNQRAVAALLLVADKMAFVDDDQIDVADFVRPGPHRLDARKRDGLGQLLAF